MTLIVLLLLASDQPAFCVQPPYGVGAGQVRPFVCSLAKDHPNPSIRWPTKSAAYKINSKGTQDIAGTRELPEIRQGFDTWTHVVGAEFTFVDAGLSTNESVGFDYRNIEKNENLVFFVEEWEHDSTQIALTTTTHNVITGEIFDADMELNDQDWDFSIEDNEVRTDLRNTITHEVGHFIGFNHTDEDDSVIDPECALTSTMARHASFGEISKRELAPSDEMGMRFVYPQGKPAVYCVPPSQEIGPNVVIEQQSGSLSACAQNSGASWLLALLLLGRRRVSLWFRRQRRPNAVSACTDDAFP